MDQSQKEVWERLYELYLEKGEHKNSQRSLKRALSLEGEVSGQVAYLIKMGLLYEEGFQDKRNAQASFVKAVEISHGSLKAVEAMAAYYDRMNDQVSKNIKIDMLWAKEVKILAKEIKGETLNTIAHLLLYKGDSKAAQLLTEAAMALGVSQEVLPVKPSSQPISAEILTSSELTPFLYPEVVKNCHRNILHLIMPELPRVAKELFDVKPPDRKSLVESLPQGLDDLLDQFDASFEVHSVEGDEVRIIPFETPVILVGEKLLKIKEYTTWQALLGGKLVLYARGDIAAVELDHEALFNLYAGIVKVGFPQRDVDGFPEDERSDWVKLAGKILGRIDKNRYQGLILEMDSLSPDSIKGVKEGYGTAQLRSAYLLTGALAPFTALYENKPSMQPMLDELTRFIFTNTHFKLRENAVFVSMTS